MRKNTLFVSSLFLAACSAPPEGQLLHSDISDTLFLADTVGVLVGDEDYTFGAVMDLEPIPGGFAVLDGIFCRISTYDHGACFTGSAGGRGEGPGEFSFPFSFCRLHDGGYLLFDQGARRYALYSSDLSFEGSYPSGMGLPLLMSPAGDSSVVMGKIEIIFAEGILMTGQRIFSMNPYSGEEGVVYREHMEEMGGSDIDLRPHYSFFTTDSSGRVYLARYDSDIYAIDVLSAGGDSLDRFIFEPEPRPEFDRETHQLRFLPITIPLTTSEGTSVLEVSAPELHPYVTYLATGPGDSIWVRRYGLPESEHWDVVSPEGELVRRVVLFADTMGTGAYPSLQLSPWGIAATMNENEVERFYTVE